MVVDIRHAAHTSIANIGPDELLTLFWINELFDPDRPDTYPERVDGAGPAVLA